MEEWIKKSDAIEAIKDNSYLYDDYIEINGYGAIEDIRALPSADRPQGEWIYTNDPLRLNDEWACSRCGNISFVRTNFCDRCGCRMKGADDETR